MLTRREFLSVAASGAIAGVVGSEGARQVATWFKERQRNQREIASLLLGVYEKYINTNLDPAFRAYVRQAVTEGPFGWTPSDAIFARRDSYGFLIMNVNYPTNTGESVSNMVIQGQSNSKRRTLIESSVALQGIGPDGRSVRNIRESRTANKPPLALKDLEALWPRIFRSPPQSYEVIDNGRGLQLYGWRLEEGYRVAHTLYSTLRGSGGAIVEVVRPKP